MAVPVIQSKNTVTDVAEGTSVVITKPTGLAVGDLMLCVIGAFGDAAFATPSGWVKEESKDGAAANKNATYCFTKVAEAADAAASNFTFSVSAGTFDFISGILFRITGFKPTDYITISEIDSSAAGTEGSLSYTTALTPAVTNSLLLFSYAANNANPNGVPTVGTYGSTPSATWTEEADLGIDTGGLGQGFAFGIASASYSGFAEITNRTAVLSDGGSNNWSGNHGMAILVNGTNDAQGTNATFAVSPLLSTQNGVAGGQGTNALLAVSPLLNTQNGEVIAGVTQWDNQDRPVISTINNQVKPTISVINNQTKPANTTINNQNKP